MSFYKKIGSTYGGLIVNTREIVFLVLLLFMSLFLYSKMRVRSASANLEVKIIKNSESIKTLDQERKKLYEESYFIDKVDFNHKSYLEHETLGKIGFSNNFFMDITSRLEVKKTGIYIFSVSSDDGFRLLLNNKNLIDFTSNRAFKESQIGIRLTPGFYEFKLQYFQADGPMGLEAYYNIKGKAQRYYVGGESEFLVFRTGNKN